MFRILSVVFVGTCMLFLSCKEDTPPVNNEPAVVNVTVCNTEGEPLKGKVVMMYDEKTYEAFEENHMIDALLELTTDAKGSVNFVLEKNKWFSESNVREFMFVVLEADGIANYRWWSRGGTVSSGKNHSFKIEVTSLSSPEGGEAPSDTEKKSILTAIEIAELPLQTTYFLHASAAVSLEGLVVEGIYEDGSRRQLAVSENHISGFSTDNVTEQLPITITIEGKQASFMIKVVDALVENGLLVEVFEKSGDVYQVPADVKVISRTAFSGTRFNRIILNEGVEEIQPYAFAGNEVREVVFPASLSQLGAYSFYRCKNLEQVDLSGTQIQSIPELAFAETAIERVNLPGTLEVINEQSFLRTCNLKQLVCPLSLKRIASEAFRESGVMEITLPNGIGKVEARAFYSCEALEKVHSYGLLEGDNKGIMEHSVFQNCPKLFLLELPESLESIGASLFSGGVTLTSLTLGQHVKKLGFNAFGNSKVDVLTIRAQTPPVLDYYSLPVPISHLNIPKGALEKYRQAGGDWSKWYDKMQEQ